MLATQVLAVGLICLSVILAANPTLSDNDVDSATKLIRTRDASYFFGNLLAIVSKLVPLMVQMAHVADFISGSMVPGGSRQEDILDKISVKIDYIAYHVDKIPDEMRAALIFQDFEGQIDKVGKVKAALNTYQNSNESISREQLRSSCKTYEISEVRGWFHESLTNKRPRNLLSVLESLQDRRTLLYESQLIFSTFLNAMALESICLDVVYAGNVDLAAKKNHSSIEAQEQIKGISEVLLSLDTALKSHYWEHAQQDVIQFCKDHTGLNKPELIETLRELLSSKYDWKAWLVSSGDAIRLSQVNGWKDTVLEAVDHVKEAVSSVSLTVRSGNESLLVQGNGRSLLVVAASPGDSTTDFCTDAKDNVSTSIDNCLGYSSYNLTFNCDNNHPSDNSTAGGSSSVDWPACIKTSCPISGFEANTISKILLKICIGFAVWSAMTHSL